MPQVITQPTVVAAAGSKGKVIEEFIGQASSGDSQLSIAHMVSPSGWEEPGQTPEFREITIVLRGELQVEHHTGTERLTAGQAIITEPGEWIRYSTPGREGAEYMAICVPAFTQEAVRRDSQSV